jgi:hypothetical protein
MFDCAKDVLAHHNAEVSLPQTERSEMKQRRDANRDRLKRGLERNNKPAIRESVSQGSYAMKTMVQHPDKDYDIDDGAYFWKEDLVGPRGAEMSALETRQMVRDALDDGSFKSPPEVRTNCVRVLYNAGYHVDVPAYRRVTEKDALGKDVEHFELASTAWKRSDARDVTKWFEIENNSQSGDTDNGRQLRRVTRHIKKFAKSRASWQGSILSGFGITKLVTEKFLGNVNREDEALYYTMKAIRDRLNWNLMVQHPVTPGDTITSGTDDPKAKFLREKLSDAISWLEPLFESDCTREKALKCWDKVFATDFFINRLEKGSEDSSKRSEAAGTGPAILSAGLLKDLGETERAQQAVRKEGGGRYA